MSNYVPGMTNSNLLLGSGETDPTIKLGELVEINGTGAAVRISAGERAAGLAIKDERNGKVTVWTGIGDEAPVAILDLASGQSIADTDIGKAVFAASATTVAISGQSAGHLPIGILVGVKGSTQAVVLFHSALRFAKPAHGSAIAALTEDGSAVGGTNDGNLPALVDPNGDAGASVIAAIREVAARVNTIQTAIKTAGVTL